MYKDTTVPYGENPFVQVTPLLRSIVASDGNVQCPYGSVKQMISCSKYLMFYGWEQIKTFINECPNVGNEIKWKVVMPSDFYVTPR